VAIESGSMNWLPRTSGWQDLQNWHSKMSEHNSRFADTLSGFGDTLLSAPVTESSSTTQIATQQMVNRMRTEAFRKAMAAAKAAAVERGTSDPGVYKPPASDRTDGTTGRDMRSLINSLSASVNKLIVVNKTV
jgi:hypothetical protein